MARRVILHFSELELLEAAARRGQTVLAEVESLLEQIVIDRDRPISATAKARSVSDGP